MSGSAGRVNLQEAALHKAMSGQYELQLVFKGKL